MNRNSLRFRVTTFNVGVVALALVVFSAAVYLGVRAFLTRSLERVLNDDAHKIVVDYLIPLEQKSEEWLVTEMGEAYPPGISDPFVRVSVGTRILYQSGDIRDPFVSTSALPLPSRQEWFNAIHRETAKSGQRLVIYTLPYRTPNGSTN